MNSQTFILQVSKPEGLWKKGFSYVECLRKVMNEWICNRMTHVYGQVKAIKNVYTGKHTQNRYVIVYQNDGMKGVLLVGKR